MTSSSKKHIVFIVTAFALISCTSTIRYSSARRVNTGTESISFNNENSDFTQTGIASYYADKFEGRATASGEIFSQDKFTAAHPTLPFGTKLKVTNLANGKSVIVIVNDRGPFAGGRIIDISKAAAEKLDMINSGIAQVKIEITQ